MERLACGNSVGKAGVVGQVDGRLLTAVRKSVALGEVRLYIFYCIAPPISQCVVGRDDLRLKLVVSM